MLKKLKNIPQKKVFKILKVSYDGLDWREKEIFLDIACFQLDMPRRYANYLWEARDLYPKSGMKVLINAEGLGRPEMCTRLWDADDALKIMLQKKVSEKILALDLGSITGEHKLSDENFKGLFNLMYLRLQGKYQFIGDFKSIRETLTRLSWRDCDQRLNPDIFKMSNLVVLHLQGGWRGVEKLIMPILRVLVVRGKSDMTMTPDVSCCLKLEMMVFEYFENLEEIHHSVGMLESLTYMEISYCPSLRSLPKKLSCARALWELILTWSEIEEVPESIGRLESLRIVHLYCNNIRRLPTSICDLKNLLVLDVANNPLDERIPDEIGSLSALEELDLSDTNIPFLPAMVSQLSSLKFLRLNRCTTLQELRGLPTSPIVLDASDCSLGNLSALEELDLSYTNIRFLPATVSRLKNLKSLKLNCCRMLQELRGLPISLTYFAFSSETVRLSEEICCTKKYGRRIITYRGVFELGFLSRLKTLGWTFPDMASLQTYMEIREFTLLEMELGGLDSLPSLTKLSINESDSLLGVSNIGRLKGLRSIRFNGCRVLELSPVPFHSRNSGFVGLEKIEAC